MTSAARRLVYMLACLAIAGTVPALAFQPAATPAADAGSVADAAAIGDIERGLAVFQRVGNCTYCHGWAADGRHGKHPRSPGVAANLRTSGLDAESMMQVVRCGLPGTAMPYHLSAAYKDPEVCGTTLDDYPEGEKPVRGKTFREKDVANVVAYVLSLGDEISRAECEAALKPGNSACAEFE